MRGIAIVLLVGCGAQNSLGYLQPPFGSDPRIGLGGLISTTYRTPRPAPPLSLVPTDGSELGLERLAGDVTIDGPIAHTTLHLTFVNTENRTREGRFSLTLPPNAAVTKFSMKINGELREGKIVARQQGREVYERFLHRSTDPALLEQDLGNNFSARVFPIAGGEHKELIVAYDHAVSAERGYDLALNGLPRVQDLQITVDNNGDRRTSAEHGALPQDVHVDLVKGAVAAVSGEAFVARVDAEGFTRQDAPLDRVMYLVDTSASRADVMEKQVRVLNALMMRQAQDSITAIMVFDQDTLELFRGPVRDARTQLSRVLEHGALGASDLAAALSRARSAGMSRVVIIGDGAATSGSDVAKMSLGEIERIDVVQVGQSLDRAAMQQLVRVGKKPGAIVDGANPDIAFRQLQASVAAPVAITVEGATNVWPTNTRHVAPGEPVFVYGMRDAAQSDPLVIHVGERTVTVTPRKGREIRRTVAYQELADLTEQLASTNGDAAKKLGAQIEKLALEHSLISSRTSMIVLETESDEQRFLGTPTLQHNSSGNIPTGRTFAEVLRATPGAQNDGIGISFSGSSSSLENQYYVDGVNTTGLTFGTVACIAWGDNSRIRADTMSALALDLNAEMIQHDAFAFKGRSQHESSDDYVYKPAYAKPYTGTFQQVMSTIAKRGDALEIASKWHSESPTDVTAIIALGEALEAQGAAALARRAYGSIADLYPNRAELLRAAGERLDRILGAETLAIDFYKRALKERPDQVTTYRLLAYALVRANRAEEALEVILDAMIFQNRSGNVLAADAGVIAAHVIALHPERRYQIMPRLPTTLATEPSLRFVMSWETDATDMDLVVDGKGLRTTYVRDGFGPEEFVAENPKGSFKLAAHYANKAQAGIGLGTLQIIRHDGNGGLEIENRPFAIQNENGRVELGYARGR